MGGQFQLTPQCACHILHDGPVCRSEDLVAGHALCLELASVLHQKNGASGVDRKRARGCESLCLGRRDRLDAKHRAQGIHQAAGSGGALGVHGIVEQLRLLQGNRGNLGVLATDIDQDTQSVVDRCIALLLEPGNVAARAIYGTARVGIVLHEYRHAIGQPWIDPRERLLHLVTGRAGDPDAA